MTSLPKIIDIDSLSKSSVLSAAKSYADQWLNYVKLSSHKSVTSLVSATWLRYSQPIDYLRFSINENPFTIFVDNQTDPTTIKPTDYSFPEKCVSENVLAFFAAFIDILNEEFDFDTRMSGDTSYIVNKQTRETRTYRNFRPFFNFPDASKSKTPTNIGHVRIDLDRRQGTNGSRYEVSLIDSTQTPCEKSNATRLQDLISFFVKFGSYRVTIKPARIISSPAHFGGNYKLMWQSFICERLNDMENDSEFLQAIALMKEQNITSLGERGAAPPEPETSPLRCREEIVYTRCPESDEENDKELMKMGTE